MSTKQFPEQGLLPINRQAASLMRKGERVDFTPTRRTGWDIPPPMSATPTGMPVMTGHRVGKIQVMGFFAESTNKYAVRCVCGCYETRTYRALTKPAERHLDCCEFCHAIAKARSFHHHSVTGEWKDF